jgi:hypothetical protein
LPHLKNAKKLGGKIGKSQIAGFVYIGEKVSPPMGRTRQNFNSMVRYL